MSAWVGGCGGWVRGWGGVCVARKRGSEPITLCPAADWSCGRNSFHCGTAGSEDRLL